MSNKYLDLVYGLEEEILKNIDYAQALADYIVKEELRLSSVNVRNERLKLLDLGCGKGLQALAFSRHFEISGLDIENDVEKLFAKQEKKISYKKANFEKDRYPFENERFDIVFSKSVIEHIQNTDHFLGEAKRLVKPEGKIVIMCPAWESQAKHFYDDYTHIKPFTALGLCAAMKASGLKNVKVKIFYQLPFVWKYPFLKFLCKVLALLPDSFKWRNGMRNNPRKLIRFSKETMLLGIGDG